MDETIGQVIPDALWAFINGACRLPATALQTLPPGQLPEPAKQLLVHGRDMTSTLAEFHGSDLRVEILQQTENDDFYLREVFLRTTASDTIVEYGVIAIALARFLPRQQAAIRAGRTPLGALLHEFRQPFESMPIGFLAVPAAQRAGTRLAALGRGPCHGRLNHLATPAGEPIAWILEILPGAPFA